MPEINSFPNNSSEYIGAEEVMHWLHGRTKGVYAGAGNAAVTAVSGQMQVSVAPGIGWMTDINGQGICWWYDSAQVLNIDPAESTGTLDRIDRIVIQWRTVDYADKPELIVLKGTDSSSAVAPALTNNATLRQISLARINIPAGTTELTQLNILDDRQDPTVCGIVTETVTADTSMIALQYEEALAELLAAIAQAWEGEISDGSITRAKLAPPLLEEIGVHSVNGKAGNVVLDFEDVGEWDLLWENASPSSSFVAQTISLDLSGYTDFKILFLADGNTGGSFVYGLVPVEKDKFTQMATFVSGKNHRRFVNITDSGAVFNSGAYENTYGATSGTTSNTSIIPNQIYAR